MSVSYEQVMTDVLELLNKISDDWEYSVEITPQTGLISDLGFESLELVVLGVSIQEHYQKPIPFPEFLADLGEHNIPDVYIDTLVEFVHLHVGNTQNR